MPDTVSEEKRSEIMSRIRGRDTSLELGLKALFEECGLEFIYHPDLPGNPDFFLPGLNAALFADSCFWHWCPRHGRVPKSNRAFWKAKLERNRERAWEAETELTDLGFVVLRLWEHAAKWMYGG